VRVKPGLDPVIPLAPEFVRPQDGAEKQDCELNAATRWLADCGGDYSPLGVTLLGDDRYCHEPFCREVLKRGMGFILVCKPASHPIVYEWLDFLETLIATAQGKGGAPGSKAWSQPRVLAAESGWGPTARVQERLSGVVGFQDSNNDER